METLFNPKDSLGAGRNAKGERRMKMGQPLTAGAVILLAIVFLNQAWVFGQTPPAKTPGMVNRGKKIYEESCTFCHGAQGNGETPIAKILKPPPRDFTESLKNWAVSQGDPVKIFRAIKDGVPDSAMLKFNLPDEDIWSLVYTVMAFSKEEGPSDKKR
jgi:mono/diheme cytochrome c family protein